MAATADPAHDLDAEPVSAEYSRVMTDWLVGTLAGAHGMRRRRLHRCGAGLWRIGSLLLLAAAGSLACSYSSVTAGSGPLPGFGCAPLPKELYPAADAAVRYMTAQVFVGRKTRPPIFLAVCGGEPPADLLRAVEGFGILPLSRAELYGGVTAAAKVVIDRESGTAGVLMNIVGFRCATDRACKLEVVYGGQHSILDLEMSRGDWSVHEDPLEPTVARAPSGKARESA